MDSEQEQSLEHQQQDDQEPAGLEVLLLERDERFRENYCTLLATSGMVVTATGDVDHALALASEKHFSVAVLDLDTPGEGAGLEVMSDLLGRSPATSVMILTRDPSFDAGVEAFRLGADDVVAKRFDKVDYILESVEKLCHKARQLNDRDAPLRETMDFLEQCLRKLMDSSRKAMQAEEAATGYSGRWDLKEFVLLVVDDNENTAPGLAKALGKGGVYRCEAKQTGGEALDWAGQNPFHMALIKEDLPDLPGTIVARSLSGQGADVIVLRFRDRGRDPGTVTLVEDSGSVVLIPRLTSAGQLIDRIHRFREGYSNRLRERRYLEAFRNEHYEFLKNYVELRRKLQALLPEGPES